METHPITHLVKEIARHICDDVDKVVVREIPASTSSTIEIKVAKGDLGKMIGKKGKTAQSIRNLIYACSFRYGKRYQLDIMAHEE